MFEADNLEEVSFTINEGYAKRYEHNNKREDLHRLQEKYGKDAKIEEDSSSGSEEDEDAMYDSIAKDKGFLRVLSKLKSKDPAIYDKDKNWFENGEGANKEGGDDSETKKKKEKPMFLKDYERETLLTKGSLVIDSDEDAPSAPTYTEEQRSLKEDLKSALNSVVDEEPVLTLRPKSDNDKEKEDEDYRQWMKGEKSKIKDKNLKSDCDHLKKAWSDPNIEENEKFLRDFILNKGWAEEDEKDFVPTYDEIVNDDDDELQEHAKFERQFNFRYEEPDHDLIKNYPRTIANSVRKNNEGRKEKRKRKQDRKLKEKEERKQEIERLKKLKLDEIETKLQILSENAGTDLKPALEGCLEEDFNPEEHDKVMSKLFDEDYYHEEDVKKPVFSDSDDDLINDEVWFNKIAEEQKTDQATNGQEELEESTPIKDDPEPTIIFPEQNEDDEEDRTRKKSWKRKRSKKFKEAVVKSKPSFNPDDGPFEQYFDEYYKLDCEDVIGDVKCRFGYRKAKRCSYGLTVDEIMMADDKELNQWYSFKKMMKYRTPGQEAKDNKKFLNKRHNEFMKRQILKSLYPEENAEQPENSGLKEKRRSKKHRITPESTEIATEPIETSTEAVIASPTLELETNSEPAKKKKKKEAASIGADNSSIVVVSAVNEELADSKKEKKKKTKVVSSQPSETVPSANSQTPQNNVMESKKKGKEKQVKSISQTRLAAYGLG